MPLEDVKSLLFFSQYGDVVLEAAFSLYQENNDYLEFVGVSAINIPILFLDTMRAVVKWRTIA